MTGYDYCYIAVSIIISLWGAIDVGNTRGLPSGVFVFFSLLIITSLLGMLVLHWPRKIKQSKEEQRLTSLPHHKIEGTIGLVIWNTNGKTETVAVPVGHSISTNGSFTSYDTYETRQIFDGALFTIINSSTNSPITIRSFKRDYKSTNGGVLRMNKELEEMHFPTNEDSGHHYSISYVTDNDGTNYFISARKLD